MATETTRIGRPLGISVLGILAVLAGIALLILSFLNLFALLGTLDIEIAPEVSRDLFLVSSALTVIVGVALLFSGIGLLGLRPWAWWLAFLVALLAVARSLFSFVSGVAGAALTALVSAGTGLALGIIIVAYLASVRSAFRSARPLGPRQGPT